jgi:hypothetical protein
MGQDSPQIRVVRCTPPVPVGAGLKIYRDDGKSPKLLSHSGCEGQDEAGVVGGVAEDLVGDGSAHG